MLGETIWTGGSIGPGSDEAVLFPVPVATTGGAIAATSFGAGSAVLGETIWTGGSIGPGSDEAALFPVPVATTGGAIAATSFGTGSGVLGDAIGTDGASGGSIVPGPGEATLFPVSATTVGGVTATSLAGSGVLAGALCTVGAAGGSILPRSAKAAATLPVDGTETPTSASAIAVACGVETTIGVPPFSMPGRTKLTSPATPQPARTNVAHNAAITAADRCGPITLPPSVSSKTPLKPTGTDTTREADCRIRMWSRAGRKPQAVIFVQTCCQNTTLTWNSWSGW